MKKKINPKYGKNTNINQKGGKSTNIDEGGKAHKH